MNKLKDFLNEGDRFAADNGMQLIEVREGYARAEMVVTRHHLNAAGVCQGGAYFTLADLAFAAVTNSHGNITLGIQNSITFLQSAHEGDTLIAEAEETFNHHRLPFCEIRVSNQRGELVCIVTGSAYRTNKEFKDIQL